MNTTVLRILGKSDDKVKKRFLQEAILGIYQTGRCPYCNYIVEPSTRTGINNYANSFGPSEEICPNCQNQYSTGRFNSWSETDSTDRMIVFIQMLITIPITALYLMIPMSILLLFTESSTETNLEIGALCCLGLSVVMSIINLNTCMSYSSEQQ